MATPVISQPQVAILDMEAIVRRPVVVDDEIAIRPICVLGLSWDHRALDGVYRGALPRRAARAASNRVGRRLGERAVRNARRSRAPA